MKNTAVTGAIVGARNENQIEGVYHASEFELNEEDLKTIEETVK